MPRAAGYVARRWNNGRMGWVCCRDGTDLNSTASCRWIAIVCVYLGAARPQTINASHHLHPVPVRHYATGNVQLGLDYSVVARLGR
jgi:hypothetical protein